MQYANQFVANMHFHIIGEGYDLCSMFLWIRHVMIWTRVHYKKILNINFTHKKMELFAYISNKHLSVQIMHTLMEIGCLSPKFTYINILYYAKLILFFFFFFWILSHCLLIEKHIDQKLNKNKTPNPYPHKKNYHYYYSMIWCGREHNENSRKQWHMNSVSIKDKPEKQSKLLDHKIFHLFSP